MIKYLKKDDEFESLTKKRCLVDFYADWCGPCQMLGTVLESYSKEKESLDIVKVNTDEFNELALNMGIMSIPALFIMENGKVEKKTVGFMSLEELKDFIK